MQYVCNMGSLKEGIFAKLGYRSFAHDRTARLNEDETVKQLNTNNRGV